MQIIPMYVDIPMCVCVYRPPGGPAAEVCPEHTLLINIRTTDFYIREAEHTMADKQQQQEHSLDAPFSPIAVY